MILMAGSSVIFAMFTPGGAVILVVVGAGGRGRQPR